MDFDRRAFLVRIRNVRQGLHTRNGILKCIDDPKGMTVREIASAIGRSYNVALYHLHNMAAEGVTSRNPDSGTWSASESPQTRLMDFVESSSARRRREDGKKPRQPRA